MKYIVIIDGRTLSNVSDQKTSTSYRSESTSKNLGGDLLIDRIGNEKTELTIKIGSSTTDEMDFLRSQRSKTSTVVKYYSGNTLTTKTMHMNPFTEPAPIYHYGDRSKGMTFPSFSLTFSEV